MKKILSLLVVALLIPQLAFGWGLQGFVGQEECFPHGVTFVGIYDSGLDADISTGSPTSTFAAARDATHPATYFDASGVMQKTETNNVGRFNYGYYDTTGWHAFSQAGLMIESASTNYLTYSIFSAGVGIATGWGITEDDTNDDTPTLVDVSSTFNVGTTVQAQRIQMTFSDGNFLVFNQRTAAGSFAEDDVATCSVFLRGTTAGVVVNITVQADNIANGNIDQTSLDVTADLHPTEWRKFTVSHTCPALTDNIELQLLSIAGVDNGDTIDIQVACANLEKSPLATSFIPTTVAVLTRNAETNKYVTLGNRTAAVESCVVKFAPEYANHVIPSATFIIDTDTKRRIVQFPTESNNCRIYANQSDSPLSVVEDVINDAWTANQEMTVGYAMQHSSPYVAGYWDGVADGTNETVNDFTDPAWETYFYVGNSMTSADQLNGTIFSIAFFDRVLSDAEMLFLHEKDWRTLR